MSTKSLSTLENQQLRRDTKSAAPHVIIVVVAKNLAMLQRWSLREGALDALQSCACCSKFVNVPYIITHSQNELRTKVLVLSACILRFVHYKVLANCHQQYEMGLPSCSFVPLATSHYLRWFFFFHPVCSLFAINWQVGPEGAGHFVKMVHNGIEYGDMQLICEAYHVMKSGLGLSNDEMSEVISPFGTVKHLPWQQWGQSGYALQQMRKRGGYHAYEVVYTQMYSFVTICVLHLGGVLVVIVKLF